MAETYLILVIRSGHQFVGSRNEYNLKIKKPEKVCKIRIVLFSFQLMNMKENSASKNHFNDISKFLWNNWILGKCIYLVIFCLILFYSEACLQFSQICILSIKNWLDRYFAWGIAFLLVNSWHFEINHFYLGTLAFLFMGNLYY